MDTTVDDFDSMSYADLAQWFAMPTRWVRSAMVVGFDGTYTDGSGSSRGLSGAADLRALRIMRALADVIVVGASTAAREGYVPGRLHPDAAVHADSPTRLAVVSRKLDIPMDSPLLTGEQAPLVLTRHSSDLVWQQRARDLADRVDLAVAQDDLTGAAIVAMLAARGLERVLCEGGPTVQEIMRADGSVDEIALTVSSQVAADAVSATGALGQTQGRYEISHVATSVEHVFLRCRLMRGAPTLVA